MKADIEDLCREMWLRKRNSGEIKWVTKDGTEIPIKDMTDKHLENAIRAVERNSEMRDNYMEYRCEIEDAGDR